MVVWNNRPLRADKGIYGLVEVGEDTGCGTGEHGGAEAGGFGNFGYDQGDIAYVGFEL